MMTCELIRELILTDYSDGQLSPDRVKKVDEHLMHCLNCRVLAQTVRKEVVEPFMNPKMEDVNPAIWRRIKDTIQEEQKSLSMRPSILDSVRDFIFAFKPMVVTACLFIMLAAVVFVRHNQIKPEPYLTYMMGSDNQSNDSTSSSIEKYFL